MLCHTLISCSTSCFRKSLWATCKVGPTWTSAKFHPHVLMQTPTRNFVQIRSLDSEIKYTGRQLDTTPALWTHFTHFITSCIHLWMTLLFQLPSRSQKGTFSSALPILPDAYHYHRYSNVALRDTMRLDVDYDYHCHRNRNVALPRQRDPWLSLSALHHAAGAPRVAHIRRAHAHHPVSTPRGVSLTSAAPFPSRIVEFRKLHLYLIPPPRVMTYFH
jgi:hypothetical protein